jgi:hypothetical protein
MWWVGTVNGIYYSITGSNEWKTKSVNSFPGGYANGIISYNQSGNINEKLISTVYGIEQNFSISTFNTNSISTGSFTIININEDGNDSLYITSFNNYANVFINNILTSTFQTSSFGVPYLEISSINVSTLFTSDELIASTIYVSTIFSDVITSSEIYFTNMYGNYSITDLSYISSLFISSLFATDYISVPQFTVSSIEVISLLTTNELQSLDILTSTISITDYVFASSMQLSTLSVSDDTFMNIAYISTVSTFNTIASTIQLINDDGELTNLYAQSNKIFFEGIDLTTQGINPTFYKYTLQDTNLGITTDSGSFSLDNENLNAITSINLNIADVNGNILTGLYTNVGINSVIHIINGLINSDNLYKIDSIVEDYSYFTFTLSPLVIQSEQLVIGNKYSIYIANIGIPTPPTPPTNIVSVKAKIAGSGFNFTDASVSITANIGTYVGSSSSGGTSFYINLSQSYSLFNIPAVVGSIVYYNGSGYNTVNVKFGSISPSNGATIVINNNVTTLSVNGLTLTNLLGVRSNGNNPSLIVTIQFLN